MRVPDAACLRANVQRHLRGDHEYVSGDVLHRRRMHDNARGVCILVSIRDQVPSIITLRSPNTARSPHIRPIQTSRLSSSATMLRNVTFSLFQLVVHGASKGSRAEGAEGTRSYDES